MPRSLPRPDGFDNFLVLDMVHRLSIQYRHEQRGHRLDAGLDGARAPDDARARLLLRRPRPLEERPQHDDDERLRSASSEWRGPSPDIRSRSRPACRMGGAAYTFLRGVGLETQGSIPHLLFMAYQGTFAIITAALISGAVVERMRFGPYLIFLTSWSLVVYAPVAHWVWGGGFLAKLGALDFAGGTVVHVTAGSAALVAALVLGRGATTAAWPSCPTTSPSRCSGPASCGLAGSASTRAARWPRINPRSSRS